MTSIDLNSDLGESYGPWRMGRDDEMLDIVTSANVACGFHAGDPMEMTRIVRMCRDKGVVVGAHPGFDDLHGFGRRRIYGTPDDELRANIIYQIGALQAVARAEGAQVAYVKCHGALANMASEDADLARVLISAMKAADPGLIAMCMAATALQSEAEAADRPFVSEVFADRAYNDNGTLVARGQPGAVIHDADAASETVLRMIDESAVTSINGVKVPVRVDTICVHGDNPAAVAMAARLRTRLEQAGVDVRAFAGDR